MENKTGSHRVEVHARLGNVFPTKHGNVNYVLVPVKIVDGCVTTITEGEAYEEHRSV